MSDTDSTLNNNPEIAANKEPTIPELAESGTDFTEAGPDACRLMTAAHDARGRAYCPYSNFHVGAAVLTSSGDVFGGCNVENACYGLSVCAERVAVMNAVANGHTSFTAMAACCDVKDSYKAPCGACRQFLAEFSMDWRYYQVLPDTRWRCVDFRQWLPEAFTPASLQLARE